MPTDHTPGWSPPLPRAAGTTSHGAAGPSPPRAQWFPGPGSYDPAAPGSCDTPDAAGWRLPPVEARWEAAPNGGANPEEPAGRSPTPAAAPSLSESGSGLAPTSLAMTPRWSPNP